MTPSARTIYRTLREGLSREGNVPATTVLATSDKARTVVRTDTFGKRLRLERGQQSLKVGHADNLAGFVGDGNLGDALLAH